jgi:hypothetical protein
VLKDTAEAPYGLESSRETPSILAAPVAVQVLNESGETAPSLTGRVGDDGPRAGVQPRIAFFVPRVNVGEAVVGAVFLDVQGGDHGQGFRPKINRKQ